MEPTEPDKEDKSHGHGTVTLEIATPKGLFTGTFPKTATIQDVINVVVEAKGIDSGEKLELVYGKEVLQPVTRTLESFRLEGTVKLELVATGSGV